MSNVTFINVALIDKMINKLDYVTKTKSKLISKQIYENFFSIFNFSL